MAQPNSRGSLPQPPTTTTNPNPVTNEATQQSTQTITGEEQLLRGSPRADDGPSGYRTASPPMRNLNKPTMRPGGDDSDDEFQTSIHSNLDNVTLNRGRSERNVSFMTTDYPSKLDLGLGSLSTQSGATLGTKKGKSKEKARRRTLGLDEEDNITVTEDRKCGHRHWFDDCSICEEAKEGPNWVIQNEEDYKVFVNDTAAEFLEVTKDAIRKQHAAEQEVLQLQDQVKELRVLKESLQAAHEKASDVESRIRRSRNEWRTTCGELSIRVKELQEQQDARQGVDSDEEQLPAHLRNLHGRRPTPTPDQNIQSSPGVFHGRPDLNRNDRTGTGSLHSWAPRHPFQPGQPARSPSIQGREHSAPPQMNPPWYRRPTDGLHMPPLLDNTEGAIPVGDVEYDSKYPDAFEFYGNEKDKHLFEQWESRIYTKIRYGHKRSLQAQVDYIRDRTKANAWDIVRTRSLPGSDFPYTSTVEMMDDLRRVYGAYNVEATAEADFQNTEKMRMKPHESLADFLARWNRILSPIRQGKTDVYLITRMRSLLPQRTQIRLQTGRSFTSIAEFLDAVQELDRQLNMWDEARPQKEKTAPIFTRPALSRYPAGGKASTSNVPKPATSRRTFIANEESGRELRPPPVVRRLQAMKACFDCGQSGHSRIEEDRPCKNQKPLSNDQITRQLGFTSTQLASVDIEEEQDDMLLEDEELFEEAQGEDDSYHPEN
ncbi:hypothetical protein K402DRAFT_426038 [Aulographum hederae CBS 113979]|uniref:Uncharacterized protein n=1 Tax=Aulographum hederae CBS 113979 TaxID=1176131 RepID=A0A6G1GI92_9PEZI|nr:hypothetical protein K402DRAFT_426038 [Aulographum hederae CBS 113979]